MSIEQRVNQAANEALIKKHYVTALDIFLGVGYLQPSQVEDWRKGRVYYLEKVMQANLSKCSEEMKCFRKWASQKGLKPSETVYLSHTKKNKVVLRFSKSGELAIERAYRTHYVSPLLRAAKEKAAVLLVDHALSIGEGMISAKEDS